MEGTNHQDDRLERIKRLSDKIANGDFQFTLDDDEVDGRNGTYIINKTVTLKIYQKDTYLSISLMDNQSKKFVSDVFEPEEETMIMDAFFENENRLKNIMSEEKSMSKQEYKQSLFDSMDI